MPGSVISLKVAPPGSADLDDALWRGLGGKPDFLNGARSVDQHPVGAHFRERNTRCDFPACAQCERRPAVHREECDSLAALALRNDANQLDVAPVGAWQRTEDLRARLEL